MLVLFPVKPRTVTVEVGSGGGVVVVKRFERVKWEGTREGDTEFGSPPDGYRGLERSDVGPCSGSRYRVMWGGKGEDRVVTDTTQSKEDFLYVCLDGVWEGSVWVGKTDVK